MTANPPTKPMHLHSSNQVQITHGGGRGAYGLGLLSMAVQAGESAKRHLAFDADLSEREVKDLLRDIWNGKDAKQRKELARVNCGFSDPIGEKTDAIESQNFDETLKKDVQVNIYYDSECPKCKVEAETLEKIGQNIGPVHLIDVEQDQSHTIKSWILDDWPHVEADGREITIKKLGELIADARHIRELEALKRRNQGVTQQ